MDGPFSIEVELTGQRLDQYLAKKTGESRSFIQKQIESGHVTIDDKTITKLGTKIKTGQRIQLTLESLPIYQLEAVASPLTTLYEDEDLLAIDKPQGLAVHPSAGNLEDTVVHRLLHHLRHEKDFQDLSPMRPGIVHRLDKGTSGVLLLAKNRKIQEALSDQFKNRQVKKVYECLVWGKTKPEGKITSLIGRDRNERKKMSSRTQKGRSALTHWRTLKTFGDQISHLEVIPHTGRTHQIRVHLSEAGNAIISDPLYGRRMARNRSQEIPLALQDYIREREYPFLHAKRLSFTHPTSKKLVSVEASPPSNFIELLTILGKVFDGV